MSDVKKVFKMVLFPPITLEFQLSHIINVAQIGISVINFEIYLLNV